MILQSFRFNYTREYGLPSSLDGVPPISRHTTSKNLSYKKKGYRTCRFHLRKAELPFTVHIQLSQQTSKQ